MLTAENVIINADGDTLIFLARGLSQVQLRTVQGRLVNEGATAPTEKEAKEQVGEVPTFGALIEFTSDPSVAQRFGTGGYVIVISIKRKYLTRGSVAEAGWIARADAPFDIIASKQGRGFI